MLQFEVNFYSVLQARRQKVGEKPLLSVSTFVQVMHFFYYYYYFFRKGQLDCRGTSEYIFNLSHIGLAWITIVVILSNY